MERIMAYSSIWILEFCETDMGTHEQVVPESRRHESTIKRLNKVILPLVKTQISILRMLINCMHVHNQYSGKGKLTPR